MTGNLISGGDMNYRKEETMIFTGLGLDLDKVTSGYCPKVKGK